MSDYHLEYYNRYTKKVEKELVYGERSLRFLYNQNLGDFFLSFFAKKSLFSLIYGKLMDMRWSRKKVKPFIKKFKINTEEFEKSPKKFKTFNDFFTRKLKPEARPICDEPGAIIFPADGRHFCVKDVSRETSFLMKGEQFTLEEFLVCPELAKAYHGGVMIISRLCPTDYHRFHFPVSGQASLAKLINGYLYSVNPIALRSNLKIFAQNKRFISKVKLENGTEVIIVEVGATCVGTVVHTSEPDSFVEKGQEKGYFKFGGSTVITLFPRGSIKVEADLMESSLQKMELFARMGDKMAVFC